VSAKDATKIKERLEKEHKEFEKMEKMDNKNEQKNAFEIIADTRASRPIQLQAF
jgi:hypothetical protein